MDVLEVTAKTVDEAIEKGLAEMGAARAEVRVTIMNEGKSGGFLGFRSEDARVQLERIVPRPPVVTPAPPPAATPEPAVPLAEMTVVAAETLDRLLKMMEVEGKVVSATMPDEEAQETTGPISLNIEGDDLGMLIGRRGQTLASLQYILRLMVGHQTKTWVPIVVDAEGYKQRRLDAIKALALRMADHVKTRGAPFTLEPMPPFERRIVHLALADHPAVYTESIGEGESRKVVIRPKQGGTGAREGNQAQPGNTRPARGNYNDRRGNY